MTADPSRGPSAPDPPRSDRSQVGDHVLVPPLASERPSGPALLSAIDFGADSSHEPKSKGKGRGKGKRGKAAPNFVRGCAHRCITWLIDHDAT